MSLSNKFTPLMSLSIAMTLLLTACATPTAEAPKPTIAPTATSKPTTIPEPTSVPTVPPTVTKEPTQTAAPKVPEYNKKPITKDTKFEDFTPVTEDQMALITKSILAASPNEAFLKNNDNRAVFGKAAGDGLTVGFGAIKDINFIQRGVLMLTTNDGYKIPIIACEVNGPNGRMVLLLAVGISQDSATVLDTTIFERFTKGTDVDIRMVIRFTEEFIAKRNFHPAILPLTNNAREPYKSILINLKLGIAPPENSVLLVHNNALATR